MELPQSYATWSIPCSIFQVNGTAGMNIRYMDNAIYAEVGLQNNATVPGAKEYVADLLRGIAQDLGIDLSSIASDNAEGGD